MDDIESLVKEILRMFDLSGTTALVTGASGGIGSAIARTWRGRGLWWRCRGRTGPSWRRFGELGGEHVALVANLSDAAAVDGLVPQAVERLGRLDILVNNAGVTRDNLAMRMKDEEWSEVIRVNLEAAFRLCRAACKPMMRARFGRIISITSVVGATGNPGQAIMRRPRPGLVGMSKALAQKSPRAGSR
jgi:3-oxoacyl-[acyl-carrier protein] reductase